MISNETQQKIVETLLGHSNVDGFTLWQLGLFAIGFLFWTLAYIHIAIDGKRDSINEMPMLAAAGNIAWEILWAFVLKSDLGLLFQVCCFCWFFVDIFINYQIITKNYKIITEPFIRKNYRLIHFFFFTVFMFVLYFMAEEGKDNGLGVESGLLLNLFMSGLYLYQMFQDPRFRGKAYSLKVAIYKMLGTTLITISSAFIWPDDDYLISLGIATFVLDVVYVYLFITYKPVLMALQEHKEKNPGVQFDFFKKHHELKNAKA